MNTALALAALLVPFALITFGVLSLMRTTEDPTEDELQELLATLRDSGDAPTDPTLVAWDGGRS